MKELDQETERVCKTLDGLYQDSLTEKRTQSVSVKPNENEGLGLTIFTTRGLQLNIRSL